MIPVFGPPPPPPAAVRLVELGYENVRVIETSKSLAVWYENRRHVYPLAALAEVLAAVSPGATGDAELRVVPLRDDMPLVEITTTPADVTTAIESRSRLTAVISRGTAPPIDPLNSAGNRLDVSLQPNIRFTQVDYAYLARSEFASQLGPGLRVLGRVQAAIYPTLGWDPFFAALRSSGWMAQDVPAVFQIGIDRGKAHLAGEVAYQAFGGLGFLRLKGGLVQDSYPEFVAKAEARIPVWDLQVGGGWASWPVGDYGPFFSVKRHYSRSLVEASAFRTNFGTQFRLTFGMDLGPDPRPAPSSIRFVPIGLWQITYLATAYAAADELRPDPDIDDFQQRLTPAYVETHLDRLPWPAGSLQAPRETGSPGQPAQ